MKQLFCHRSMRLLFYGARQRGSAAENKFMNDANVMPSFYEIIILWCQTERKCGKRNKFMNEATFLPSFYEIIILWHQTERKSERK